jgi:Flp pilus assembly protein TadG
MRLSTERALLSPPRGRAGRRPGWRREDGQSLVEFALILPVLLLILTGILKFGLMFNNYITLTDAVRSGARSLALGRGLDNNPCAPAVLQAENTAAPTINLPDSAFTTQFSGAETCMTGIGWFQGDQATLKATYPCDLTILGVDFFPGCTLTAEASEAIE